MTKILLTGMYPNKQWKNSKRIENHLEVVGGITETQEQRAR